ncbi:30S ribosome-binding factor RbfA [Penaeicola halotolerans]|uniref:30S ribosome-binding factor RbfA n=1 Tax=Penaeicola halotolerans TaxID=2793196 RepID=UPI001CF8400D|nr:30S ribosome-binding factor RbfA [Penaeicola halotolerans]
MESTRQQKYAKLLQKELGEILQKEMSNAFGKVLITVKDTKVSPDLSFAKFYLSFLPSDKSAETMTALGERKSEIRKHLGLRIGKQVRIVPSFAFFLDDSGEYADHIEKLLAGLDIPPAPEEDEEEED